MKTAIFIIFLIFITGCSNTNNIAERQKATPSETPITTPVTTPENTAPIELSSFSTQILDKDSERVNNLKVCAKVLDNFTLMPGETFSFNGVVGKRTEEKGYEEARILIGKDKAYAVGGGVCQVSSTIYNAAAKAGLEIVERHNHQNEVHYVPIGQDAAVTYGVLDLKFKNNLSSPIKLSVTVNNDKVQATILKASK